MLTIVETLADYAPVTKDPDLLTEYVRHRLSRSIVTPYLSEDGVLGVITLGQDVEDTLLRCIQKTEHGSYLSIDPRTADAIVGSIKEQAEKSMAQNLHPIIITSPAIRRHLKKMTEYFIPSLVVLSQNELMTDIRFQSIGEVTISNGR